MSKYKNNKGVPGASNPKPKETPLQKSKRELSEFRMYINHLLNTNKHVDCMFPGCKNKLTDAKQMGIYLDYPEKQIKYYVLCPGHLEEVLSRTKSVKLKAPKKKIKIVDKKLR